MFTQTLNRFSIDDAVPAQEISPETTQWESEIAAFEAIDHQSPPAQNAIVFIGSSSIAMWEALPSDFPSDFPGHAVVNRGFGGSQIGDSTHHAERILQARTPRLIVLYAGDNDLADGKTPEQVAHDFQLFVERVYGFLPDTRIAFLSIKPSPSRRHLMPRAKQANDLIHGIARQNETLDFIDIFPAMLDEHGAPRAELFGPDELHMNRAGYKLWIPTITPHLEAVS